VTTNVFKRLLGLFVRPFRARFTAGSLVIVLNENEELLLVRNRYRERGAFSLPGGFIRYRELPAEAAQRELREEASLVLPIEAFLAIATYEQPWAAHIDNLFVCRIDRFAIGRRGHLEEIRSAQWVALSSFPPLNRGAAYALRVYQLWRQTHSNQPAVPALPEGVRYEAAEKAFPQYQAQRALVGLMAFVCSFGCADVLNQTRWLGEHRLLIGSAFAWLALIATAMYIILSYSVYTYDIPPHPPHSPRSHSNALVPKISSVTRQLNDGQLAMIIGLLTTPASYFDRITESVSPGVTESTVHTNFTIRVPNSACDCILLLPVHHQWRGYLTDGLRFFASNDERLSTASQETGIVLLAAVIRRLLISVTPTCLPAYIREIERDVIDYLASDAPQSRDDTDALIGRVIANLPAGDDVSYVGALLKAVSPGLSRGLRVEIV
jgi:ADP-ribose pyrophosphatase YjhB (NUDIX family)